MFAQQMQFMLPGAQLQPIVSRATARSSLCRFPPHLSRAQARAREPLCPHDASLASLPGIGHQLHGSCCRLEALRTDYHQPQVPWETLQSPQYTWMSLNHLG